MPVYKRTQKKKQPDGSTKLYTSKSWWISYYDADGKQVRLNTGHTIKTLANEELALHQSLVTEKKKKARNQPSILNLDRKTVLEIKSLYLSHIKANRKEGTYINYKLILDCLLDGEEAIITKTKPESLNAQDIQLLEKALQAKGRSDKTVNNYKRILSQMLEWAVKMDYLESNPIKQKLNWKSKARLVRSREAITRAELDQLLSVADEEEQDLLIILFFTGCRKGELAKLKWAEVDLEAGIIHVRDTKTAVDRTIPIGPSLKKALTRHRKRSEGDLVCPKWKKTSFYTNASQAILALCEKAGIKKHISCQSFRRGFVSELLRQGVSVYTVSRMSGHSPQVLLENYAMSEFADLENAISKLE